MLLTILINTSYTAILIYYRHLQYNSIVIFCSVLFFDNVKSLLHMLLLLFILGYEISQPYVNENPARDKKSWGE